MMTIDKTLIRNHTLVHYCDLLILSRNCPEHLKVTTRLAANIISAPVAGFLPFL
jgi:hypothetical protein